MGARPCRGPFPPLWGLFYVLFSPYVEIFLGLHVDVQLTKISHVFATRVVLNMSP